MHLTQLLVLFYSNILIIPGNQSSLTSLENLNQQTCYSILIENFLQCICQSSTFTILWKDVSFMFSRTTNHSHSLFHLALIDTSHDKSVIWISSLNSPQTSDMSNALKRLYQMLFYVWKQMHYNKTSLHWLTSKRWQQVNVKTLNSFKYSPFHLHLLWNPYPYKCQRVTLLLVYPTFSFRLSFAVQCFIPLTLSLILEYETPHHC